MRISDWSSDVCSSDLCRIGPVPVAAATAQRGRRGMSSVPDIRSMADRWRPRVSVEMLALFASGFFALACNLPFWHAALAHGWEQWRLALALFALLLGLHGLLLGLVLARPWAKPALMALFVVTACATSYMQSYGVYLDRSEK